MPRKTYLLDESATEIVKQHADQRYDGNESMAARDIIKDWQYLTARFAALGKRTGPEWDEEYHGEGVA